MRPGAYPFTELEAALVRAVDNPPVTPLDLLWDDDSALLRAVISASYFPDASPQVRADLESILDSIQIG